MSQDVSDEMISAGMVVLEEFVEWRDYPYTAEDLVGAILRAGAAAYVAEPVPAPQPKTRRDDREGFVYFVKCGDHIKIGKAKNVQARMAGIKVSTPEPLECLGILDGGHRKEREMHKIFSQHRTTGGWFTDCVEIRDFVKANCKPPPRERIGKSKRHYLYAACTGQNPLNGLL